MSDMDSSARLMAPVSMWNQPVGRVEVTPEQGLDIAIGSGQRSRISRSAMSPCSQAAASGMTASKPTATTSTGMSPKPTAGAMPARCRRLRLASRS